MREAIVEQAVKTYFTDQFPQFSTAQQCEVQFGTRHGIADVVLHQPIRDEKGYKVISYTKTDKRYPKKQIPVYARSSSMLSFRVN